MAWDASAAPSAPVTDWTFSGAAAGLIGVSSMMVQRRKAAVAGDKKINSLPVVG